MIRILHSSALLVALAVIANAFAFSGRASAQDQLPNPLAKHGDKEFAVRNGLVVPRPEGNAMKRIPFNYNKVISAGDETENFYRRNGDIVLVP